MTPPTSLKSAGFAEKFLSTDAAAYSAFNVQRHLTSARTAFRYLHDRDGPI